MLGLGLGNIFGKGSSHHGTRPTNTVAPVLSGTPTVGQTLSCTTGTWTGPAPITYAYQWYRALVDGGGVVITDGNGDPTGTPIGGATASTYVLVVGDVGSYIFCTVTASNGAGSTAKDSNVTATTVIPAVAAATWNYPSTSPTGLTLSNGNRTAVGNDHSSHCVLTNAVVAVGQKSFFQIVLNTRNANPRIGFATTGHTLTDALGSDNPSTGFGLFLNTGLFADAGGFSPQLIAAVGSNGDVIDIKFDEATRAFAVSLNGGAYNTTNGGANATATVASGGLAWHAAYQSNDNDSITANFAASDLITGPGTQGVIPSGYTLLTE